MIEKSLLLNNTLFSELYLTRLFDNTIQPLSRFHFDIKLDIFEYFEYDFLYFNLIFIDLKLVSGVILKFA